MGRRPAQRKLRSDFKADPFLVTIYQVAETLGRTADEVREALTPAELTEWSVYLNSPFSQRSRELMMNGWMVHVIRSIVADKRHKPKFADALFPFDKIAKEFFREGTTAVKSTADIPAGGVPKTPGEVEHAAQVLRRQFEQRLADYKAGRIPDKNGLYVYERVKQ